MQNRILKRPIRSCTHKQNPSEYVNFAYTGYFFLYYETENLSMSVVYVCVCEFVANKLYKTHQQAFKNICKITLCLQIQIHECQMQALFNIHTWSHTHTHNIIMWHICCHTTASWKDILQLLLHTVSIPWKGSNIFV